MKKSKKVGIIIIVVALLVSGVSTAFYMNNRSKTDKTVTKTTDKNAGKVADKATDKPADNTAITKAQSSGEKLNVSIGSGEGSAEGTVIIPINFDDDSKKGVDACDFKISYDPKVLEAVSAVSGELIVDGEKSLSSEIDNANGTIGYLFMDNTAGKQAIVKKGLFSKITFKVKKDAPKGSTKISLKSLGAFIDEALEEHEVTFKDGTVTVK